MSLAGAHTRVTEGGWGEAGEGKEEGRGEGCRL